MTEITMAGVARNHRRRALAALKAAFVVAMPFLVFPVVFGRFGLVVWACLFLPSLFGIVLVQLPVKLIVSRYGCGWGTTYFAVLTANAVLTLGIAVIAGVPMSGLGSLALVATALIAASIWHAMDDKALDGASARYSQGSYHA